MTARTERAARSHHQAVAKAPLPVRILLSIAGRASPRGTAKWVLGRMLTPRRKKLSSRSASWPDPEPFAIDAKGRRIQGYSWGATGQPLALLVHGWEGQATDLDMFVGPLLTAGYKVVAFDAPAHGGSEGRRTDVLDMADTIASVLESRGSAACIVAHSIGCAAAAEWASRNSSEIGKLVAIAPGGDLSAEIDMLALALSLPARCIGELKSQMEAYYGRPLIRCSTASALRSASCPVLVVHDRMDRVVSFGSGLQVADAVGADLFVTDGLGHRKILRDNEVIGRIVAFCMKDNVNDPYGDQGMRRKIV